MIGPPDETVELQDRLNALYPQVLDARIAGIKPRRASWWRRLWWRIADAWDAFVHPGS